MGSAMIGYGRRVESDFRLDVSELPEQEYAGEEYENARGRHQSQVGEHGRAGDTGTSCEQGVQRVGHVEGWNELPRGLRRARQGHTDVGPEEHLRE